MGHLSQNVFRGKAALSVMRDQASGSICLKRAESGLRPVGLPLLVLALLSLCLLMAVPQPPAVAQDSTPLTAPTNLAASVSAEGITLSWTAPAGLVDGYEILRRRPLQGETELATLVDNTGDSATSYTDTSATELGVRYIYRIKSIRGADRSGMSLNVQVDFPTTPPPTATPISVSVSCEVLIGNNHDILQCTASAGDLAITSALWTPSFEAQYAQTSDGPIANWVIADEYCGQSTTVEVAAQSGSAALPTAETTITLECAPAPADTLTVSCENLIENSQHVLRCSLSGGDQTVDFAQWIPSFEVQYSQIKEGAQATEASWTISDEYCGQVTDIEVDSLTGTTIIPTVVHIHHAVLCHHSGRQLQPGQRHPLCQRQRPSC